MVPYNLNNPAFSRRFDDVPAFGLLPKDHLSAKLKDEVIFADSTQSKGKQQQDLWDPWDGFFQLRYDPESVLLSIYHHYHHCLPSLA